MERLLIIVLTWGLCRTVFREYKALDLLAESVYQDNNLLARNVLFVGTERLVVEHLAKRFQSLMESREVGNIPSDPVGKAGDDLPSMMAAHYRPPAQMKLSSLVVVDLDIEKPEESDVEAESWVIARLPQKLSEIYGGNLPSGPILFVGKKSRCAEAEEVLRGRYTLVPSLTL